MTTRKIIGKLHLWLGLASGLIVVFLGVTGCILAFELEIRAAIEPFQYTGSSSKNVLPPSVLTRAAEPYFKGRKANSVEYRESGKAARVSYYDEVNYQIVFLDPHSGEVLKWKDMSTDFFRVVLMGHYYLWLPPKIGQPIVASATGVFLVMMISGLILWWPRNKAARPQRFSIKWSATWKRKNYDLHNVLGFYMTWVAIVIAITGLVMGFEWFAKSFYWVSSGGVTMPEHIHPVSDTTQKTGPGKSVADAVWTDLRQHTKPGEILSIYFPLLPTDPLEAGINHRPGTYYNSDFYHYDQYSGKELPATGIYAGKFRDASLYDKISRMNYDLHIGAALGLPGKILAFFASLIAASLPVTGFLIWYGRRRKRVGSRES